MTIEAAPDTRYARKIPEGFAELQEYASDLLWSENDQDEITAGEVRLLVDRVDLLDDETLEKCRYYGLGLMICEMARMYMDPVPPYGEATDTIREHYVGWASKWTVDGFFKNRFKSIDETTPRDPETGNVDLRLRIDDINSGSLSGYNEARAAAQSVGAPTGLLTESLVFVSARRRGAFDEVAASAADDPAKLAEIEGTIVERILEADYSVQHLSGNLVSATLSIVREALITKRQRQRASGVRMNDLELSNPAVSAEEIRSLNIGSTAARFASMHLNQFRHSSNEDGTNQLLVVSEVGQACFTKEKVADIPKESKKDWPKVLHEETLKCPALHVPGMLRLAQGLVVDVVERSEDIVTRSLPNFERHYTN
jgi:hypothetical protein